MSVVRSTYRRVRRAVNVAIGRDVRFDVQTNVAMTRHGSEYGGWWVSPLDLTPGAVVYSVGIGTDITFDLSIIRAYGVTVHAFDPTPVSLEFLKQQSLPAGFSWHPYGLASYDGIATFHPPADPSHVSHSMLESNAGTRPGIEVQVRRLRTLMRDLGHSRIDVLKIDIEGAEYDVLSDILDTGLSIRQLLVEFHHRMPGVGINRTRQAVAALNAAGYRIAAVAESGEEISFVLAP